MFNSAELIIDALTRELERNYVTNFGREEPGYPDILSIVARTVLERIANSDALYHDLEHTIMVASVGQQILTGQMIKMGQIGSSDWLHFVAAVLCHDIGYVRGVCLADQPDRFVCDESHKYVELPKGSSDAALAPHHVDRGKIFVKERFGHIAAFDVDRLAKAIELTRFPVPNDEDHQNTDDEAGLVRAADLIGQLADPHYLRKINALYHEFAETGVAEKLGYSSPADLALCYPRFYWAAVRPYLSPALDYLNVTQSGKQWVSNLYANVFAAEHREFSSGPETQKLC